MSEEVPYTKKEYHEQSKRHELVKEVKLKLMVLKRIELSTEFEQLS